VPVGQFTIEERRRQNGFRTVGDAAAWVAEKYPWIDLDSPYQKGRAVK